MFSSPPLFPVISGKSGAEPWKGRRRSRCCSARADRARPAAPLCERGRRAGGWVRGREGGRGEEGEARQSEFKFRHKSKQILSFPERCAPQATSNKLCLRARTWGHRICRLLSPLSYFLSPYLYSPPTPPFSLYFSALLAVPALVSLLRSLRCPHFSLQAAASLCLFICEETIPFLLTAAFPSLPYFQ